MMKSIAVILVGISLVGCATVPKEEVNAAARVKVVDISFLNSPQFDCQKVGPVSGDSVGAAAGQSAAVLRMKAKAAELGANVVSSNFQFTPTIGLLAPAEMVRGIALKCPEATFAKINSIEEITNY